MGFDNKAKSKIPSKRFHYNYLPKLMDALENQCTTCVHQTVNNLCTLLANIVLTFSSFAAMKTISRCMKEKQEHLATHLQPYPQTTHVQVSFANNVTTTIDLWCSG